MRILVCSLLTLLFANAALAEKIDINVYNPSWGGIVPGVTNDNEVVALYGKGVISSGLGHGPGRCYTNKEKTVTLTIDIGVDDVVESVTIKKGLHFPPDSRPFISKQFQAEYNKNKHLLDATKAQIRKLWGEPDRKTKNEFIYLSDSENSFKAIRVEFKNGRTMSVQFYSGEPIDFYGDEYETD